MLDHTIIPQEQSCWNGEGSYCIIQFYGSMGAPKYNELVADYKLVYEKLDLSGKEMH